MKTLITPMTIASMMALDSMLRTGEGSHVYSDIRVLEKFFTATDNVVIAPIAPEKKDDIWCAMFSSQSLIVVGVFSKSF